ncbi:MAG: YfhO family protein, partial [Balneolaceae bacterium]|nr:YfhO family protein [Balneolaceae bacterium]
TLIKFAKTKKKSLQPLYLPLGIALGIGLLFVVANDSLLSYEKPGERQQLAQQVAQQNNVSSQNPQVQQRVSQYINNRMKPDRKELAQSDSLRYLLLVVLASALIVAFTQRKLSVGFFLAGLLIIAAYDMLSVGNRYISEQSLVSDDYNAEQILAQRKRPIDTFLQENVQSDKPYPYRVFPLLDNPFNNAVPSAFYPTIGGYSGAKLSYYQDLIDAVLMQQGSINMPVLDMLNVKYVTFNRPLPFPNMQQVYSQNNRVVMENTDVLPKAFFVDSVANASSPQDAVNALNSSSFNPAKWAIVESENKLTTQPDSAAHVQVTSYEANQITLSAKRSTPGFLVLSEIWYPAGWEATINGEPAKIYKTNFVLRGIQVPTGEHQITFTFEPAAVYWGNLFSWIGHVLLLCIGIGVFIFAYRDR